MDRTAGRHRRWGSADDRFLACAQPGRPWMSLWRTKPRPQARISAAQEIALQARSSAGAVGSVNVDEGTALRSSAVWACIRLRADHMSTLPVDNFRDVGSLAVEVNRAPIFDEPGGTTWPWHDWVWASQSDLDR